VDFLIEEADMNRALRSLEVTPRFVQSILVSFSNGSPRVSARVGLGRFSSEVAVRFDALEVTPSHGIALRVHGGLGRVLLRRVVAHLHSGPVHWDDASDSLILDAQRIAPWFRLTGIAMMGSTLRLTGSLVPPGGESRSASAAPSPPAEVGRVGARR
jgi:hypothetical protein